MLKFKFLSFRVSYDVSSIATADGLRSFLPLVLSLRLLTGCPNYMYSEGFWVWREDKQSLLRADKNVKRHQHVFLCVFAFCSLKLQAVLLSLAPRPPPPLASHIDGSGLSHPGLCWIIALLSFKVSVYLYFCKMCCLFILMFSFFLLITSACALGAYCFPIICVF